MHQVGVFQLGQMLLALPATSLREVVPYDALCPMPCESEAVVGGINVRGSIIPALDLNRLLKRDWVTHHQVVLIMTWNGFVLGLLADNVAGIIEIAELPQVENHQDHAQLGSFVHPELPDPIHLLSLEHLFSLPGIRPVPDVISSGDGFVASRMSGGTDGHEAKHMMVVRCGKLMLTLDSTYVHSTIPCPELLSSALRGDYCKGAISFEGKKIAAVDLMALLGFPSNLVQNAQAFVVELESGMIACLVEEIVDVVQISIPERISVPNNALPRPDFVRGVLSVSVIEEHPSIFSKCESGYLFDLSGDAIRSFAALEGLARMNVAHEEDAVRANRLRMDVRSMQSCQVICYDVGYEVVSPMSQITEILPWHASIQVFGSGLRPDGVVVSRGRVIPSYELCGLLGEPLTQLNSLASILVVELEEQCVGFVVPKLLSIDQAMWPQGQLKIEGVGEGALTGERTGLSGLGTSGEPVRVGEPEHFRLVCVVDLVAIAKKLCRAKFSERAANPV